MVASIPNDIFQFSTYTALQRGFDIGQPRAADLTSHGTDGIGTFEDGKLMILLDSIAYSIDENGQAHPTPAHHRLPFAMVTVFHPEMDMPVASSDLNGLENFTLGPESCLLGGRNSLKPIKLQGLFKSIQLSNDSRDDGKIATRTSICGTIFGFMVPAWMEGICGPRIHCHFLSAEMESGSENRKRIGGRVMDFESEGDCTLGLAKCGRFHLGFPQDEDWEHMKLS